MKNLNYLIVSLLCTGILCLTAKLVSEIFDATKSTVLEDGRLYEPLFFLVPIGYMLIVTGILLSVVKLIMKFRHRNA